jgi:excisionase family DNA binding protein
VFAVLVMAIVVRIVMAIVMPIVVPIVMLLHGRLLTPEELSEQMTIPIPTLYRWRHEGKGPRAIRVGKHLRYRPEDVDAWLELLAQASEKPS